LGLVCGISGTCIEPPDAAEDGDGGVEFDAALGDAALGDAGDGDGSVDDGSVDDGSVDDGSVDDGSVDDASLLDGNTDGGEGPLDLPVLLPPPKTSDAGSDVVDAAPDAQIPEDATSIIDSGIFLPDTATLPPDSDTALLDGGILLPDAGIATDSTQIVDGGVLLPDASDVPDSNNLDASDIGDFPVLP